MSPEEADLEFIVAEFTEAVNVAWLKFKQQAMREIDDFEEHEIILQAMFRMGFQEGYAWHHQRTLRTLEVMKKKYGVEPTPPTST